MVLSADKCLPYLFCLQMKPFLMTHLGQNLLPLDIYFHKHHKTTFAGPRKLSINLLNHATRSPKVNFQPTSQQMQRKPAGHPSVCSFRILTSFVLPTTHPIWFFALSFPSLLPGLTCTHSPVAFLLHMMMSCAGSAKSQETFFSFFFATEPSKVHTSNSELLLVNASTLDRTSLRQWELICAHRFQIVLSKSMHNTVWTLEVLDTKKLGTHLFADPMHLIMIWPLVTTSPNLNRLLHSPF